MNKTLSKAIMNRSRLQNVFHRSRKNVTRLQYKQQRNYCVNLTRKVKREYYSGLQIRKLFSAGFFYMRDGYAAKRGEAAKRLSITAGGSGGAVRPPGGIFWILDLLDSWKLHSKCDYSLEIRNPYEEKNGGPLMKN